MSVRVSLDVELAHVCELADDVGRLRRHLAARGDDYGRLLAGRIAGRVAWLDVWAREPASVRFLSGRCLTVAESLAEVDREKVELDRRLGVRE